MKPTKEQLNKINEGLKHIIEFCPDFSEYRDEIIFSDEDIKEIVDNEQDIDTIDLWFPGESNETCIEIDDFIGLVDEIKSIEIVDSSYIKTKKTRYYIVTTNDYKEEYILTLNSLHSNYKGININLIDNCVIVGMAAVKLGEYQDNEWGSISPYLAIGIEYENENDILSKEEEKKIIDSYIFEVADTMNIALTFSEIRNPTEDLYHITNNTNVIETLRELEPYNIGMEFFVSAIQIKDPKLKFLNYYKVLEHFSPIAINIEANELMRKKLDAPKKSFEDGDYIRSIFLLANSMKDRFNDEDLIKAAFNICFDVGIFKTLPETLKRNIKKEISEKDLDYNTNQEKIRSACNIAGKVIYRTRNVVVHAKSNFNKKGDEIDFKDFKELNNFMKIASSQAIRWYTRQPSHLKLQILK